MSACLSLNHTFLRNTIPLLTLLPTNTNPMDSPSMSSTVSNAPGYTKDQLNKHEEEEEVEEELELGLTLGAKTTTSASRSRSSIARTSCRILTAKDFPSLPSTRPNVVAAGIKRAAADSNSSNQMVVGWPPVRSFRINNLFSISKDNTSITAATTTIKSSDAEIATKKTNHQVKDEVKARNNASSDHDQEQKGKQSAVKKSSSFVKVKMDGDPIGRKVDLSAHHSYESLAVTLELMFQKPTTEVSSSGNALKASKLLDGSSEFSLTYEDKDGDWMLVGDVPWRMFFYAVKRLRIMRTSDGKGIALE